MTNHDRIKRAFDALSPKRAFIPRPAPSPRPRLAAALCAGALLAGMTAAYAADVGGIQEKLTVWILGRPVEAVMERMDGGYALMDDSGQIVMTGSGVVIEPNGVQRPMKAGEMAEFFQDSTGVVEKEDGSIWFYWQDNEVDITHLFSDRGTARVDIPGRRLIRRFTVHREADGTYSVGMTWAEPGD